MTTVFNRRIFSLLFVLTLFIPALAPVSAQDYSLIPCQGVTTTSDPNTNNGHPCTFNDLVTLAQNLANRIVQLGLILSPIIFAYAGYLLVTSQDNPKKRDDAKGIMWNVVKGITIMLLAWLLVDLVLGALLSQSILNSLPWKHS
jgi:ABC-type Fe3+ transport system permease subunit